MKRKWLFLTGKFVSRYALHSDKGIALNDTESKQSVIHYCARQLSVGEVTKWNTQTEILISSNYIDCKIVT